jgi:hypothetical protein
MKNRAFLACFLFFSAIPLFCQTSMAADSREVPPAPVVSSLTASCERDRVSLAWIPAYDVSGVNLVLRSNRPITAANYGSAETRATIPVAETNWSETLADANEYYYAIMTRDADGTLYDFFLPASNSLLVPVRAETANAPVTAAFAAFDAMTRNDAVIITWNSSVPQKKLVLYRSTSPFADMTSLAQAVVVSSFRDDGAPYVDYPVPGIPYFYAILDEESIRTGSAVLAEGMNTNRIPVEIPSMFAKIKRTGLPSLRSMPLPWLNPAGEARVVATRFSPKTERTIAALVSGIKQSPKIAYKPYVFERDQNPLSNGEEYTLYALLRGNFSASKWNEAVADLSGFLAIRRTEETADRAHFYLGQSLFFAGMNDKALLEFLLSEDRYYNQSREWIERVLSEMIR